MSPANAVSPAATAPELTGTDIGSPLYYELESMTMKELETVFQRGHTPELDDLVGWQFRGMNTPRWAKLLGIKKFIKGFYRDADEVFGYNSPVVQNDIHDRWIAKPSDDSPKRFGFYRVAPVDPTAKDNEYLHAVLLDYGKGKNPRFDPSQGLRDYVVQVDADNPNLLLGKAYYALGPARIATNFFLIERYRPGIEDVSEL